MNRIWNVLVVLCLLCSAVFAQVSFAETPTVVQPPSRAYSITVDHHLSLEEMIALGRYDWVSKSIRSEFYFPSKVGGTEQLTVELVSFDGKLSSNEVLAELVRHDLRPATIKELLAFGAAFPDEQLRYPIIALGSYVEYHGWRRMPGLYKYGVERDLNLYWWGEDWSIHYRFLAVRK